MQKKKLVASIFLLLIMSIGCGRNGAQNSSVPIIPIEGDQTKTFQEAKGELIAESDDRSIRILKYKLASEQVEEERKRYSENDLLQIPVDPKHNATLFKIDNVDGYENSVFFAPKIYAYGGQDGARISPKMNNDGTVTLDFPVILTTGELPVIPAHNGSDEINLPKTMVVQHIEELKKNLSERYGAKQNLAILPGCPKRIYLKFSNMEFDASSLDLKNGDYCASNTPFTVSITLPKEDARYMLEEAIYNNSVDIRVTFETKARLTVSKMRVEFDKKKIFSELEARLKVNVGYLDADIKSHVTKVIRRQAMKVSQVGEITSQMDKIVADATALFFEPYIKHDDDNSACSKKAVCLRLSYSKISDENSFVFEWGKSKTVLTGQNYLTWTKLSRLNDEVEITSLKRGGDWKESGLTVNSGDLFEIKPTRILQEVRELNIPEIITNNNNVCVETRPICISEDNPRVPKSRTNRSKHNKFGGRCILWDKECKRYEDQWTKVTNYNSLQLKYQEIVNPVGKVKVLFDGLALRFVWRDGKGVEKNRECALNTFHRKSNGQKLTFRVENRPDCKIFTADSTAPMVYLVNRISFPFRYKHGRLVTRWDGQVLERPQERIYQPDVIFTGKLMIRGYSFGAVYTHAAKID